MMAMAANWLVAVETQEVSPFDVASSCVSDGDGTMEFEAERLDVDKHGEYDFSGCVSVPSLLFTTEHTQLLKSFQLIAQSQNYSRFYFQFWVSSVHFSGVSPW